MNLSAGELVGRASASSTAIVLARHRRALEAETAAFRRLLATVPDYSPRDLGVDAVTRLTQLAEGVIARIEQWVNSHEESDASQVRLVECVYAIRRELENMDRWRRHYFDPS